MANGHGGRRQGGGRKKHPGPPLLIRTVLLTVEQYRLLKMWGAGNASEGMRWLVDQAALLVRKADPPRSSG